MVVNLTHSYGKYGTFGTYGSEAPQLTRGGGRAGAKRKGKCMKVQKGIVRM